MGRKRIVTILIVIATIILAGVAIFTAIRLYQLRQQAVAPTAPESTPAAAAPQTQACTQLAFTISAEEPSPTPTPTGSPSPSPGESPTASPTASPTGSPTSSPIAQASPSPTAEPELPEAGVSYPTVVGAAAGAILILFSLLLAL